jgi:FkbM family methyltransferase
MRIPEGMGIDRAYADEQAIRDVHWHPGPGEIVIDIGAAIGNYTIPALLNGALVIAVDPDRKATAKLARVARFNGMSKFSICTAALWDDNVGYPQEMRDALEDSDFSYLIPPASAKWLTLDQMVAKYRLDRLDWVKMDVEGAELGVLRGGVDTLTRFHPRLIIEDHTEVYPFVAAMDSRRLCRELLERLGYQVQEITWGPPPRTYLVTS